MEALKTLPDPRDKVLSSMYVEDAFKLRIGDLGRGVLKPDVNGQGKKGWLFLADGSHMIKVDFEVVGLLSDTPKIILSFSRGPKTPIRRQEIDLLIRHQGFGMRPFFKRGEKPCGNLYVRIDTLWFGSRQELRLKYRSSDRKPTSPLGILLHQLQRMEKISLMSYGIQRISYAGKLTRKARAVVHMSNKWNPVEGGVKEKVT